MKKQLLSISLALSAALALSACSPPENKPRYEHEPAKEWVPKKTPRDLSVSSQEFFDYDLSKAYAVLKEPQKGKAGLLTVILRPLRRFVLNGVFVETPKYRTTQLSQMIHVFNNALLKVMVEKPAYMDGKELAELKQAYYNTVFSGCSRDLKYDCVNDDIFRDNRTTAILVMIASEQDAKIDAELKTAGSTKDCIETSKICRDSVEERYRILAMGNRTKKSRLKDEKYTFAYLKYSRLFAFLMDFWRRQPKKLIAFGTITEATGMATSYLTEVHGGIFETLIGHYKPQDLNDPEFKTFVENFNPWVYSNKDADLFRYGTRVMFEMAAQCCLYTDSKKIEINQSVKDAIELSQKEKDDFGLSFSQIVADIKKADVKKAIDELEALDGPDSTSPGTDSTEKPKKKGNEQIFKNLRMEAELKRVEDKDPELFNEYFFMVDRLFREHLDSAEVLMLLRSANQERALEMIPKIIQTYVRVYLVYMIVETNRFMSTIYNSDTIGSDEVFQEAILKSREISTRWLTLQSRIDMMDKFLGSYFKGKNLLTAEYTKTSELLKSVNRNVHYLSVYPNMIVMTYYLAKMGGKITVRTWWGASFEIPADTILDVFFDGGVEKIWFRFGNDPVLLSREMILYALHYALGTNTLETFVAKDDKSDGSDRSKFFEVIFTKYLDENIRDLGKKILAYERDTFGHKKFASSELMCAYEEAPAGASLPEPEKISLLKLDRYTYSGAGDNGVNAVLSKLLTASQTSANKIRTEIENRVTYVQTMIDIIEGDLLRTGKIKEKGDSHSDLTVVRGHLKTLEELKRQLAHIYVRNHQGYFDCFMKLREIEQRRMNRLYEEERIHLGTIYDKLAPLADIQDEAVLNQKIEEINQNFFRKAGSGYRFDKFLGKVYRMSKYDLLMRMKKRIESDIFLTPTPREEKVYGKESLKDYVRRRRVSVYIDEQVERDPMVQNGLDAPVYFRGSREEFIVQGMRLLNGKTGSFVQWHGQVYGESNLKSYLSTLREFFLMGPVEIFPEGCDEDSELEECKPEILEVSAKDLIDAYVTSVASFSMNEFDLQNAREFGVDGKRSMDFFEDLIFEKDSMISRPLFYTLMKDIYADAQIKLDTPGPINEAKTFAQTMNNLQVFVFDPWSEVKESIRTNYGNRSHTILDRVSLLFAEMQNLEDTTKSVNELHPGLAMPYYVVKDVDKHWFKGTGRPVMVDGQTATDLGILRDDFVQKTGNFYRTRPLRPGRQ